MDIMFKSKMFNLQRA
jgi:CTD small phosphatase-like protein 2